MLPVLLWEEMVVMRSIFTGCTLPHPLRTREPRAMRRQQSACWCYGKDWEPKRRVGKERAKVKASIRSGKKVCVCVFEWEDGWEVESDIRLMARKMERASGSDRERERKAGGGGHNEWKREGMRVGACEGRAALQAYSWQVWTCLSPHFPTPGK